MYWFISGSESSQCPSSTAGRCGKHLRIGVLLAFIAIVGTAIDLPPILSGYREMVRNIDTIVHELCLEILVEHLEVDALL